MQDDDSAYEEEDEDGDEDEDEDEHEDAADHSDDNGAAKASAMQRTTRGGHTDPASDGPRTRGAATAEAQTPVARLSSGPRRRSDEKAADGSSRAMRLRPARQLSYVKPADVEEEETLDIGGAVDDDGAMAIC